MDRPYSLYDVLNVSPGAPSAAIEAAYRALMKTHHPDRTGAGAGSRAAEINAAFSVLRDPARRADYDRRESARQHALIDAQLHRLKRRRRIAGWGAWSAAALLLCAATAYAAQRYAVRPAPHRAHATEADSAKRSARLDPAKLVSEVLAEAAELRLAPRPAAAGMQGRSAGESRAAPARASLRLRRRAEPSPPRQRTAAGSREPAEGDFLEREGYIY